MVVLDEVELVVVDMLLEELVSELLVELVRELVELVCELLWAPAPASYKFKRFGPPQYSVAAPAQVIEHPLVCTTEPAFITLPQKHSDLGKSWLAIARHAKGSTRTYPYSTPIYLKPEQMLAHCSTDIVFWATCLSESARLAVPSE